ncbi:hypothetical protein [Streptomyces sp. NPDC008265]|uniref:hypothetical protein n=1 Tax=Streptomyces sp. NPDC008265 TaxID=3364824 RepID=UPI0036E2C3AD
MKIVVRSAVRTDLPALLALYSELNPDDAPLPQEKADATSCGFQRRAEGFRHYIER